MKIKINRMGAAASDLEITPADNNKTAKVILEEALIKLDIRWTEGEDRG